MSATKKSRLAQVNQPLQHQTPGAAIPRPVSPNLDHIRKMALPKVDQLVENDPHTSYHPSTLPSEEGKTETVEVATSSVTKKKLEFDVVKEILGKIKKDNGGFNFIPLSTGKLIDVWFTPTSVMIDKKKNGDYSKMIMYCHLLIDTCPMMAYPSSKEFTVAFRSDPREIIRICLLFLNFHRSLNGEITMDERTFNETMRIEMEKSGTPLCSIEEPDFAKFIFDYVYLLLVESPKLQGKYYFCKKPTSKYVFPPCVMVQNKNSFSCAASTGFEYEYRIRQFVCDEIEKEELGDEEEGQVPESQDPLL